MLCSAVTAQTSIIVNEVSQGSNLSEFVELLVVGEPECNNVPCIDIRGWIIDDNDGGTYGSGGVASGCIRLSQDVYWSCIPIGTIIILYREGEPFTTLPPDDIYDSDNDCIHVIPFGTSTPTNLFEIHPSMPTQTDPTYASINDPLWGTAYDWDVIGMRQGGDVIQIINPATLTSVFAVAWGDDNANPIIYVNDASASGNVYFMDNSVDNDPFNNLNWTTIGNSPADDTPGAPNNAANGSWISSMNYGCGSIDTLNIDSVFTNPSCGSCDGSVGVNFLGGIAPFVYSWDNGSTSSSISNLCNSNFKVTVTDNNGCTDSTSVTVTNPLSFTATPATLANESCLGASDGGVTVTHTAASSPVTYNWSNGGSGTTQTGLGSGVYTVTVQDVSGCVDIKSTTVTAGISLTADIAAINGQCFDDNNFSFDGSGSEAPNSCGAGCPTYTWDFDDGITSSGTTASDLLPDHSYTVTGTYNVSLTVFDGTCSSTDVVSIDVFSVPGVTITPVAITCNGANNGIVTSVVANGTPIYSYSWSNGKTTNNINALSSNSYSVTVSDSNNCIVSATTSVSEPSSITVMNTVTDVSCNSGNNGSISITVFGGTSGYVYNWSDGNSTAIISNLSSATYSLTVSDNNNCKELLSISVNEPSAIIPSINSSNTTCNSNTGSASITATGGASPYTFDWNTGNSGGTISGLNSATYVVTITDNINCTTTSSIVVIEENFVSITNITSSSVTTPGGNNGTASVASSGGISPYTYLWNNGATANSITNLIAAIYCVTVSDVNNCQDYACVTVNEPANMKVTITPVNILCFGGSTGSFSANISDGTEPYTYQWKSYPNNIVVGTDQIIENLIAGSYFLLVTDNTGYTISSDTIAISQPTEINAVIAQNNISCNGLCDGSLTVSTTGGTSPYAYWWEGFGSTNPIENLCMGSYLLTVTDNNNCAKEYNYSITEPSLLLATYSISDTFVCVGQTIKLTVIPTGGTLPYGTNNGIIWGDAGAGLVGFGPHTLSPQGNEPEKYSFTVFDANGCAANDEITIRFPTPLLLTIPDSIDLCIGQNTTFCAEGSGGSDSLNYTFTWTNGVFDSGISKSCQTLDETGTTTVRVILSDGCSVKDTAYTRISVHEKPAVSFGALDSKSCPPFSTPFSAFTSVGNSTFEWDFNGDGIIDTTGTPIIWTYTESGIYDVTLKSTTEFGCIVTNTINNYIEVYPAPVADFVLTPNETTFLNPKIKADGSYTIGADSLMKWTFGDGSTAYGEIVKHNYAKDGTYEVILSTFNEYGCFDADTQLVIIHPAFTIYIPNAFHPTGLRYNDYFYPVGIGLDPDKYSMYIFDRWGHQIFYTKDINEYWDGTIKGSDQLGPQGVYIYKIYVSNIETGEVLEFVGHVTLLK